MCSKIKMSNQVQGNLFRKLWDGLFFISDLRFYASVWSLQPKASAVTFRWLSFRTLYSLLTLIGLIFLTCIQTARFFIFQPHMIDIHRQWYFVKSVMISIFFLNLARRWPKVLRKWDKLQRHMFSYGEPMNMTKKARIITVIFMVLFLVDYFMVQMQRLQPVIAEGKFSFTLKNWNRYQRELKYSYVYELLSYDLFSGFILVILQIQVILVNTFLDILIVIISVAFAIRLAQVTARIKTTAYSRVSLQSKWMELREDYNRLECFCKFLNSELGIGILLSFVGNLGVLLIQLFNSLKVKKDIIGKLYLYYSFLFLLSKTIAVCFFGSSVNEEGKKPLRYLNNAADFIYYVEIDRLIRQLSREAVVLSGLGLFSIKRSLVLAIAGSIVTYELVLIEFSHVILKDRAIVNNSYLL